MHDPLFTDDDVEDLLDHLEVEDATCPGCSQPRHESFNPENQDGYEVRKLRCHACEARDQASAAYDGERHGLYFVVSRAK